MEDGFGGMHSVDEMRECYIAVGIDPYIILAPGLTGIIFEKKHQGTGICEIQGEEYEHNGARSTKRLDISSNPEFC